MPFGLTTAQATFQRMMDRFRSGLPEVFMLVYQDDLIVISPSFETHLKDLEAVFQRFYKFKLNRSKCSFCCDSVRYLGHLITP